MPSRPYDFTEPNSWLMPMTRYGFTYLTNTATRAYHCVASYNSPAYWEQDYVANSPSREAVRVFGRTVNSILGLLVLAAPVLLAVHGAPILTVLATSIVVIDIGATLLLGLFNCIEWWNRPNAGGFAGGVRYDPLEHETTGVTAGPAAELPNL